MSTQHGNHGRGRVSNANNPPIPDGPHSPNDSPEDESERVGVRGGFGGDGNNDPQHGRGGRDSRLRRDRPVVEQVEQLRLHREQMNCAQPPRRRGTAIGAQTGRTHSHRRYASMGDVQGIESRRGGYGLNLEMPERGEQRRTSPRMATQEQGAETTAHSHFRERQNPHRRTVSDIGPLRGNASTRQQATRELSEKEVNAEINKILGNSPVDWNSLQDALRNETGTGDQRQSYCTLIADCQRKYKLTNGDAKSKAMMVIDEAVRKRNDLVPKDRRDMEQDPDPLKGGSGENGESGRSGESGERSGGGERGGRGGIGGSDGIGGSGGVVGSRRA